ncbi:MAG: hypothetical protein M0C28_02365 [Candidatus Moduliflexus flocculans]|nr:hypothetical protein [Candidatus Moduliflexus flocculans]
MPYDLREHDALHLPALPLREAAARPPPRGRSSSSSSSSRPSSSPWSSFSPGASRA